jgi:hypothetical protein
VALPALRIAFILALALALAAALAAPAAAAAAPAAIAAPSEHPPADFTGNWSFDPAKSRNVGMMASLEMRASIEQTPTLLIVREHSTFQGRKSEREVRYDLIGRPVQNLSPMGDKSETLARWEGSRLVTTWTSEGAVAGSKVSRTETRSLPADGKEMVLESARGSSPPVVMVFTRE